VMAVRSAVSKPLEAMRKAGKIGSSLDAEVALYCDETLRGQLERLGDELRFVLITSEARVLPMDQRPPEAEATEIEGLFVQARASEHAKCVRCWHHRPDVGADPDHPGLGGRCVAKVAGDGEKRETA